MLYFHRMNVLKVLVLTNKVSVSKEIICQCPYFVDKGFRFQPTACNGCHDVSNLSVNINNITVLNINGIDYCCIIFELAIEAKNDDISKTSKKLIKITYYKRNKEILKEYGIVII